MVSSVISLGVLVLPGMSPGYGGSAALMDTAILLHNITRIVQVSYVSLVNYLAIV